MPLQEKINRAIDIIRTKGRVAVALSGGVDSSVVATLTHRTLGDKALAVTVSSPIASSRDLDNARKVTCYLDMKHAIIDLNELEIPGFSANPTDRCYLCKRFRFNKLKEFASEKGYNAVADGTNLSDFGQYRPGMKASEELGIFHPLAEAGISKEATHKIAMLFDLPVASEPSNSCIAARLPYGEILSLPRLKRIDDAENCIRNIVPVRILRVRDHGTIARIETSPDEQGLFLDRKSAEDITEGLKELGYKFVTLDLTGYRFGSFDGKSGVESR